MTQCEQIRAELTGTDRLGWVLMCFAGLRPAGVAALDWLDVGQRSLSIHRARDEDGTVKGTKTERGRTVPLIVPLQDDLRPLRQTAGWVVSSPSGGMLNPNNCSRRRMAPAAARAGVKATP